MNYLGLSAASLQSATIGLLRAIGLSGNRSRYRFALTAAASPSYPAAAKL